MKFKTIALTSAASLAVLALASCGKGSSTTTGTGVTTTTGTGVTTTTGSDTTTSTNDYTLTVPESFTPEASMDVSDIDLETATDEQLYTKFWGTYEQEVEAAESATSTAERYYHYAKAEAYILDQALYLPMTTEGGTYGLTRAAYRSVPYAKWGLTNERLNNIAVATDIVKPADRQTLKAKWQAANNATNEGGYSTWSDGTHKSSYNPVQELTNLGYTVKRSFKAALSEFPQTFDPSNTYRSTDIDHIANLYDTLIEYDNAGNIVPGLAESWTRSEDGLTYTFKIRQGVKWVDSTGAQKQDLTANDFVFGIKKVLENATTSYMYAPLAGFDPVLADAGTLPVENLGVRAVDDYTLEFTLSERVDYFLTYLTYVSYMPLNQAYYESTATVTEGETTYEYGSNKDKTLYCGPFYVTELTDASAFKLRKNANYWDASNTTVDEVIYTFDDFSNQKATYDAFKDGTYDSVGLNTERMALAKADGLDQYKYVTDTTAGTYFGGFNLNRKAYATESYESTTTSTKSDDAKALTKRAMLNTNFRRALLTAIDKEKFNAAVVGADVALFSLRNTYVPYDYVALPEATAGYEAGTVYGDVVLGEFNKSSWGQYVTALADGYNAFYSTDLAQAFINKAFEELGLSDTDVVEIDYPYQSYVTVYTTRAQVLKASVENATGGKIKINLVACNDKYSFYYSNYYVDEASQLNYDIDISSGWLPDFGDPSTYINTFSRSGDMVRLNGINAHSKSEE